MGQPHTCKVKNCSVLITVHVHFTKGVPLTGIHAHFHVTQYTSIIVMSYCRLIHRQEQGLPPDGVDTGIPACHTDVELNLIHSRGCYEHGNSR